MPGAEIVVVHGGNDRTLEIACALREEFPQTVPVRNENDRGKGHGVKTGIARACGDIMAQFDADLQFFAADLPALVQPLLDGECDVCLGSRFLPASNRAAYQPSLFRDLGNRLLATYLSLLVGDQGDRRYRGGQGLDPRGDQADRAPRRLLQLRGRDRRARGLLGLRLKEVPVSYASRRKGASMHAGNLAVAKAGAVIILKCLACWFRTIATRRRKRSVPAGT